MKITKSVAVALALPLLLAAAIQSPAVATGQFSVSISQATKLYDGQIVSVKANNVPSDKGLYVMECLLVNGGPSQNQADCTPPQNGLWLSTAAHASDPSQAHELPVVRNVGTNDCAVATCGIISMRDHGDLTDRSLDSVTPITLSTLIPTLNKTSGLADAGDSITVTITGLDSDKGIYVEECQLPTDGSKPSDCYSVGGFPGVWATNVSANLSIGATDASKSFVLPVIGSFNAGSSLIDCQIVSCGVFTRRDHLGSTDRTLDTVIPLSFATPVKVSQSVTRWNKAPKTYRVKVKATLELTSKKTVTDKGTALTWATSNAAVCKLVKVHKAQHVKALKTGQCTVSAQAEGSSRLLPVTYTWSIKVIKRK